MFTIDNDKPQALGALVKFPAPPKAPTVQNLKPGLTLVDGKMAFDPALSSKPPAPKPPEPAAATPKTPSLMDEIVNEIMRGDWLNMKPKAPKARSPWGLSPQDLALRQQKESYERHMDSMHRQIMQQQYQPPGYLDAMTDAIKYGMGCSITNGNGANTRTMPAGDIWNSRTF